MSHFFIILTTCILTRVSLPFMFLAENKHDKHFFQSILNVRGRKLFARTNEYTITVCVSMLYL